MLQKIAHYNDFSEGLKDEIQKRVETLGKKVRFKFNLSHPNPDPQKYNGDTIWPNMYTLDPTFFRITDTYEKDKTKSATKTVAHIKDLDDKGVPKTFHRVRVFAKEKGLKIFDMENPEDVDFVILLLLHPKMEGGIFRDKNVLPVFSLVDDVKVAKEQRTSRQARIEALSAVGKMNDEEIQEFSDAMLWEVSTDPDEIRNKVEDLAEHKPDVFNDLIKSNRIEYQAAVKRALDLGYVGYDPVESKYTWLSTGQLITVLGFTEEKNHVEAFATWLITNGKKGDEVYKKIKSLVSKKLEPTT